MNIKHIWNLHLVVIICFVPTEKIRDFSRLRDVARPKVGDQGFDMTATGEADPNALEVVILLVVQKSHSQPPNVHETL